MSEAWIPPDSWEPGTAVQVGDVENLAAFEDAVAALVQPSLDDFRQEWEGRPPLKGLIYPNNWRRKVANVVMTVMDDPYGQLVSAAARGWRMPRTGRWQLSPERQARCMGFSMRADAIVSGEAIGHVLGELWYLPPPSKEYARTYGRALMRVVAATKLDTVASTALGASRQMATEQARHGVVRPMLGGNLESDRKRH